MKHWYEVRMSVSCNVVVEAEDEDRANEIAAQSDALPAGCDIYDTITEKLTTVEAIDSAAMSADDVIDRYRADT